MGGKIERRVHTEELAMATNLSDAWDNELFAMGNVRMPATWTAASIGFKVADVLAGTYLPLYDDNGNLVQIDSPTADKAYTFPAEVAAARFVKLWSQDGAGANANQGAARTLYVDLKS